MLVRNELGFSHPTFPAGSMAAVLHPVSFRAKKA